MLEGKGNIGLESLKHKSYGAFSFSVINVVS